MHQALSPTTHSFPPSPWRIITRKCICLLQYHFKLSCDAKIYGEKGIIEARVVDTCDMMWMPISLVVKEKGLTYMKSCHFVFTRLCVNQSQDKRLACTQIYVHLSRGSSWYIFWTIIGQPMVYDACLRLMTVVLSFVIIFKLFSMPWLPIPLSRKPWKGKWSGPRAGQEFICCHPSHSL